jgi:GNAT superfamily N-acetyltransferase
MGAHATDVVSPPAVALRPVTPADAELLIAVYGSTRAEELAPTGWTAQQIDAFIRMQFAAQDRHWRAEKPGMRTDVVLVDGEPAGRLYVDRLPAEIRVVDIALLPEHRGAGVGGGLLQGLLDEGARAGLPVTIHVERGNRARTLYERLGFTPVSTTGVYDLLERRPPATSPSATEASHR